MPFVRLPDGMTAHIKMAKPRQHRCSAMCESGMQCSRPGSIQCDYATGKGRTCNAYVCRAHATSVGPDIDHCPTHARHQAGLFTSLMESNA
jgi:hypothetical protein